MMKASEFWTHLAGVAVRRWRPIIGSALVAGAIAATLTMIAPREWLVPFAFVAETDREAGGSALASELGFGGASTTGPDFYVDLLKTNEALLPLMAKKYKASGGKETTIADLLKVGSGSAETRIAKGLRLLHARILSSASRRSGVVSVTVRLPDQLVAKEVADDLLAAINDVNTRVRQTKGRNDRVFSEERLNVVKGELRTSEEALRMFLERNRFLASSPSLQVERMRLEREISVHTATLESVQLAFEAARRDEVKNTPRISVIEQPRVPALGMARNTLRKVIIAMILVAGLVLVLLYRAEHGGGGTIRTVFVTEWRRFRTLVNESAPDSELRTTGFVHATDRVN